jgi:hypothetical protein
VSPCIQYKHGSQITCMHREIKLAYQSRDFQFKSV